MFRVWGFLMEETRRSAGGGAYCGREFGQSEFTMVGGYIVNRIKRRLRAATGTS